MSIRLIMEAKYSEADFGEYFRFLVSCAGTPKGLTHDHHIAPRKQFPELADEPENLITLSVDDHATAHRLLGAAVPEMWCGDRWIASQSNPIFIAERAKRCSEHMKKLHTDSVFAAANVERIKKMNADPVFAAEYTERCCRTFTHIRWHVKRGIVSPKCELCKIEEREIWGGFLC